MKGEIGEKGEISVKALRVKLGLPGSGWVLRTFEAIYGFPVPTIEVHYTDDRPRKTGRRVYRKLTRSECEVLIERFHLERGGRHLRRSQAGHLE